MLKLVGIIQTSGIFLNKSKANNSLVRQAIACRTFQQRRTKGSSLTLTFSKFSVFLTVEELTAAVTTIIILCP